VRCPEQHRCCAGATARADNVGQRLKRIDEHDGLPGQGDRLDAFGEQSLGFGQLSAFAGVRSGFEFGLCCVGSCIGLMLMLMALGVTSVTWMSVIAVIVLAQKLLPPKSVIDVPLALAIAGLGILIVIAPSSVPGLMPPM
jgi:hypothetical protein